MAEIALGEQDSPNTISDISEKLDTLELDSSGKEAATAVTMEEESSIQSVQGDSKESSAPLETTADDTASDDSEYEEADDDDGETKPVSKLRSKDSDDESVDSKDKSSASDEEDADERPKAVGEEKEDEKGKKLDDDEDRRNPQYIPKKGAFYEHDDRTTVESEVNGTKESGVDDEANATANKNNANDGPNRPIRAKKVWTDSTGDMWSHDLYVEEEQSPKTPRELINTYGYDIRNEEAPPKARRRRRYGRGPKSYTRKWDDEPAYKSNNAGNPSRSGSRRSFVNKPSEFPEISPNKNQEQKNEETPQKVDSSRGRHEAPKPKIEDTRTNSNQNSVIKRRETNRQRSRSRPKTETNKPVETSRQSTNSNVQTNKPDDAQKRGGRGHFSGYGPVPCLEFTPSRGRGRHLPDSKKDFAYGPCYKPLPNSQIYSEEEMYSTEDVIRMIQPVARVNSDEIELHSNTNEKRPPEPPVNRSKRYSAQRQRSLPETTVTYSPPVPPTAPTFYQPETHAPPPTNQPPTDRYSHLGRSISVDEHVSDQQVDEAVAEPSVNIDDDAVGVKVTAQNNVSDQVDKPVEQPSMSGTVTINDDNAGKNVAIEARINKGLSLSFKLFSTGRTTLTLVNDKENDYMANNRPIRQAKITEWASVESSTNMVDSAIQTNSGNEAGLSTGQPSTSEVNSPTQMYERNGAGLPFDGQSSSSVINTAKKMNMNGAVLPSDGQPATNLVNSTEVYEMNEASGALPLVEVQDSTATLAKLMKPFEAIAEDVQQNYHRSDPNAFSIHFKPLTDDFQPMEEPYKSDSSASSDGTPSPVYFIKKVGEHHPDGSYTAEVLGSGGSFLLSTDSSKIYEMMDVPFPDSNGRPQSCVLPVIPNIARISRFSRYNHQTVTGLPAVHQNLAVPDYPPPQPPPMPMVAFAPPPFPPPPPPQPAYAAAYPMPTVIRTPQLPPPQLAPPQMQPPQLPPQMQPQMAPPQLPPPHPQPVQQVQEVYQGQNGITYYSPQSQAAIPRQTPSRRKKVAIPILPPPEAADMSLPPPPLGHPEQADAQT